MNTTATGHKFGKTYRSTYWGINYQILREIHYKDRRGDSVECLWADGRITIHSTPRGKDPEIS